MSAVFYIKSASAQGCVGDRNPGIKVSIAINKFPVTSHSSAL